MLWLWLLYAGFLRGAIVVGRGVVVVFTGGSEQSSLNNIWMYSSGFCVGSRVSGNELSMHVLFWKSAKRSRWRFDKKSSSIDLIWLLRRYILDNCVRFWNSRPSMYSNKLSSKSTYSNLMQLTNDAGLSCSNRLRPSDNRLRPIKSRKAISGNSEMLLP